MQDALVEAHEVRAREQARAQARGAQDALDHAARGGLAVRAGDVDDRGRALRVAEQFDRAAGRLQPRRGEPSPTRASSAAIDRVGGIACVVRRSSSFIPSPRSMCQRRVRRRAVSVADAAAASTADELERGRERLAGDELAVGLGRRAALGVERRASSRCGRRPRGRPPCGRPARRARRRARGPRPRARASSRCRGARSRRRRAGEGALRRHPSRRPRARGRTRPARARCRPRRPCRRRALQSPARAAWIACCTVLPSRGPAARALTREPLA